MTFEERGSMDDGYNPVAGLVRRMARRTKFKGSLPVVPYGDEKNTFIIALAFDIGTEELTRQKLKILEEWVKTDGTAEILEVKWKETTRSKRNSIITVKFREKPKNEG